MSKDKEQNVNEDTTLAQTDKQTSFFTEVWEQIRLVYKLLLDPEVPIYLKALPFAAIIYLILPVDFLPDVIPGLGQLDDLGVLLVGAKMFIDLAPHQIVEGHLRSMRAERDGIQSGPGFNADELESNDPDVIEGIIIEDGDAGELE
jgi:uncharacterized membrane protein YkvA (DUF1232 family)